MNKPVSRSYGSRYPEFTSHSLIYMTSKVNVEAAGLCEYNLNVGKGFPAYISKSIPSIVIFGTIPPAEHPNTWHSKVIDKEGYVEIPDKSVLRYTSVRLAEEGDAVDWVENVMEKIFLLLSRNS